MQDRVGGGQDGKEQKESGGEVGRVAVYTPFAEGRQVQGYLVLEEECLLRRPTQYLQVDIHVSQVGRVVSGNGRHFKGEVHFQLEGSRRVPQRTAIGGTAAGLQGGYEGRG